MDQFSSPSSSNITGATYDETKGDMVVTFSGGGAYRYWNVPPDVWAGFKGAPSKGSHFHRQIKGRYNYTEE